MTHASDLTERTARAMAWVVAQHAATDLATLADELRIPDDPQRKAMFLADLNETYFLALGNVAAQTYGLCLLQADPDEAGKVFRSADVQSELRLMTNRITKGVLSK